MRRRRGISRFRSRRKGYDWIVTRGDQNVLMLDPLVSPTLAEFLLITLGESQEIGEPFMVERVVGQFWATSPFRSGEANGCARLDWGIRVADCDATNAFLPADPGDDRDMDLQWMLLRSHVYGNIGNPGFQSLPINLFPNVSSGGRHAPQGGPAFDINVKRKMHDRQVLTLSASWDILASWIPNLVDQYNALDEVGVYLHVRTLVRKIT